MEKLSLNVFMCLIVPVKPNSFVNAHVPGIPGYFEEARHQLEAVALCLLDCEVLYETPLRCLKEVVSVSFKKKYSQYQYIYCVPFILQSSDK